MGFHRGPNIVRDNLSLILDAASLRSYSGSGVVWTDLSGNNYDNTLSAEVIGTTAPGTMRFNGTSHSTSMLSTPGVMGTGDWSIAFWWKSNGNQSNYTSIISQGFTGSPSSGAWTFKVASSSQILNFTYCTPGIVNNNSSSNPNTDAWRYIVATRIGTQLLLYLDLAVVKTITLPGGFSFGTGETTYIAYNPRDSAYAEGDMSPISMYTAGLSLAEITQNFNAQKGRFGL